MVAAPDVAVFTLGTLPGDATRRRQAEELAARVAEVAGGMRVTCGHGPRRPPARAAPRPAAVPISSGTTPTGSC